MVSDNDIVMEFLDESRELIDRIESDVMDFERNSDAEIVNRIYRAFHTLKGNAYMLGYGRLGDFSHKAEDVLCLIRNGEVKANEEVATLLLNTLDAITDYLERIRQGQEEQTDTSAISCQLENYLNRERRPEGIEESSLLAGAAVTGAGGGGFVPQGAAPKPQAVSRVPVEAGSRPEPPEEFQGVDLDLSAPSVLESEAPQEMAPQVPALPGTGFEREKGGRKILIVEDDFTSRALLHKFLSTFGECHIAKDGLEAIQAVSESYDQEPPCPYDLICMDVLMPKMNGTLAAKTIREIERGKGIEGTSSEATIFMTSAVNDTATIIKACYECGANYYFVKPLDFRQMDQHLHRQGIIA